MISNKILLPCQGDYFDAAPCVIIVPIMTREQAIGWRGTGCSAIMLIGKFGEEAKTNLRSVCNLTFFSQPDGHKAEPDGLTTANSVLQEYAEAILFAQQQRKP